MSARRLLSVALLVMTFGARASAEELAGAGDLNHFTSAPYVALAVQLQILGKDKGVAKLREWAETRKHDKQVIVLCRMLFVPGKDGEFRRPLLGGPGCLGGTRAEDWPLEPITIIDGIPFRIVTGYRLAGVAEGGISYLDYCLAHTNWSIRRYRIVTDEAIQAAFEKLKDSPKWKRPLTDWELSVLREQIAAPAAP